MRAGCAGFEAEVGQVPDPRGVSRFRKRGAVWPGLAAGLLSLLCCQAGPPNVLLISLDTVRADHLDVYGYERATSPNLRRLAEEGVVFEQAFSQVPWTVASHMSVFTSLYPTVHSVTHMAPQSDTVVTLPQILKRGGYATAGFVAPVLNGYGFTKGFDYYFSPRRARPAALMVDRALQWLAGDSTQPKVRAQPFFLFLHLFDPHHPYEPPWPFDTAYVTSYRPGLRAISASHPHQQDKHLSAGELFETMALYDGEIAYTDYVLGRLFHHLRRLGVYDSSLIVVMGDHGEGFLEHGLMNHGNSVYEELIRVPLLMKFPGGRFAGKRIETLTELTDITPTLADYLGLPPPEPRQGVSLMGRLREKEAPDRAICAFEGYAACVRTDSWKLIDNPPSRFTAIPRALHAKYELYDLRRDRAEQHNLAAAMPERVRKMAEGLSRRDERNRALRDRIRRALQVRPVELTEEQNQRLRALGYIQ